jgi:sec-independent protein translocase protein TatB
MFDFGVGYSELFVLGIIAVIVIGPKDLPIVLRKFGQMMQKVRGMAREFQGHVDVAMKEAGVADLKKDLQGLNADVNSTLKQATNSANISMTATPKSGSFDKYFGDSPVSGETRVAGQVVSNT